MFRRKQQFQVIPAEQITIPTLTRIFNEASIHTQIDADGDLVAFIAGNLPYYIFINDTARLLVFLRLARLIVAQPSETPELLGALNAFNSTVAMLNSSIREQDGHMVVRFIGELSFNEGVLRDNLLAWLRGCDAQVRGDHPMSGFI